MRTLMLWISEEWARFQNALAKLEKREFWFLASVLALQFSLGVHSIIHFGYMGQDYNTHYAYATIFFKLWNFSSPNSPVFYWLPNFIYRFITEKYAIEIWSFLSLILNTFTLCFFYLISVRFLGNSLIRASLLLILAFLPARFIHSLVFAADAPVVLPFVLLAIFAADLLNNPVYARAKKYWVLSSLLLTYGISQKYSMVALLPVFAVIWVYLGLFKLESDQRKKMSALAFICLFIPSAFFIFQMAKSYQAASYTTHVHWKAPEAPVKMNWKDILVFKTRDLELFEAPIYWDGPVYEDHRYSYPGLLYFSTFTDTMLIQGKLPPSVSVTPADRPLKEFRKVRREDRIWASRLVLWLALPVAVLSFFGLIFCLYQSGVFLLGRSEYLHPFLVGLTLMAVAFHLVMVINFPKLAEPYRFGYWLPRYIIPSLMAYFAFGYYLLFDFWSKTQSKWTPRLTFAYSALLAFLFILD